MEDKQEKPQENLEDIEYNGKYVLNLAEQSDLEAVLLATSMVSELQFTHDDLRKILEVLENKKVSIIEETSIDAALRVQTFNKIKDLEISTLKKLSESRVTKIINKEKK